MSIHVRSNKPDLARQRPLCFLMRTLDDTFHRKCPRPKCSRVRDFRAAVAVDEHGSRGISAEQIDFTPNRALEHGADSAVREKDVKYRHTSNSKFVPSTQRFLGIFVVSISLVMETIFDSDVVDVIFQGRPVHEAKYRYRRAKQCGNPSALDCRRRRRGFRYCVKEVPLASPLAAKTVIVSMSSAAGQGANKQRGMSTG